MGGAFISLFLSKHIAKWMLGVNTIDERTTNQQERQLVNYITELATKANVKMPEIGIYQSPEINAFATGMSKNKSLIAVSSGLLERMPPNEIKAVLGHEITHISNGDMVTMTLLQGIVNAFVMFLARILALAISGLGRNKDNNNNYFAYYITTSILEVIFMILGSIPLAFFSRLREYKADKGSAYLVGKENMISALKTLKAMQEKMQNQQEEETTTATPAPAPALNALKISSSKRNILTLFATHPPLEDRIERLEHLDQ
jgi:heat shock protein HtpX